MLGRMDSVPCLSNKVGSRRATSHEVIRAPLQACQVGSCGGAAGNAPRGSYHAPSQLSSCYGNWECQLQVACMLSIPQSEMLSTPQSETSQTMWYKNGKCLTAIEAPGGAVGRIISRL